MRKYLYVLPMLMLTAGCSRIVPVVAESDGEGGEGEASRAAAPAAMVIPSGTTLNVRLDEAVNTKSNRVGDPFTAKLVESLVVGGLAILPEGTEFSGHLTKASASGRKRGRCVIRLTLDTFDYHGRRIPIQTSSVDRVSAARGRREKILVSSGVGIETLLDSIADSPKGAVTDEGVAAAKRGDPSEAPPELSLPAKALLRFTLRSPVTI